MDDLPALSLQDFAQGLTVGAIPLAGHDHRRDVRMVGQGGIDAFDPGADGAGQARGFGLAHAAVGLRGRDEQVVQVHRRETRGQHHLHRDGGGESHPGAGGMAFRGLHLPAS